MNLREPCLSQGWYPRETDKIDDFLKPFAPNRLADIRTPAVIAPHAGWYYSGAPAALALSSLDKEAQTVAVIGGHLAAGMPVLVAEEDGVKTPIGVMNIDRELRDAFRDEFSAGMSPRPDRYQDNTVEVLLPMVRYFFPQVQLLWLRFPADISSFQAGKLLAKSAGSLNRRVAVIGSTDLTHYGTNYGYSPRGRGKRALDWVKNVNDAAFIAALVDGDPSRILKHAGENAAACSAGAVLGALGFASAGGKTSARLLDYRTSADVHGGGEIPDSFVGYAAVAFDVA